MAVVGWGIFCFDNVVGVAHKFLNDAGAGLGGINTQPKLWVAVIGVSHAIVLFLEKRNSFGLAFDIDVLQVVDVKVAKHVSAHIENQYIACRLELGKGEFLLYLAQRQAIISQLFYIHESTSLRGGN